MSRFIDAITPWWRKRRLLESTLHVMPRWIYGGTMVINNRAKREYMDLVKEVNAIDNTIKGIVIEHMDEIPGTYKIVNRGVMPRSQHVSFITIDAVNEHGVGAFEKAHATANDGYFSFNHVSGTGWNFHERLVPCDAGEFDLVMTSIRSHVNGIPEPAISNDHHEINVRRYIDLAASDMARFGMNAAHDTIKNLTLYIMLNIKALAGRCYTENDGSHFMITGVERSFHDFVSTIHVSPPFINGSTITSVSTGGILLSPWSAFQPESRSSFLDATGLFG